MKFKNARAEYSKLKCITKYTLTYCFTYVVLKNMDYDNNVRLIYCCDLS